MTTQSPGYEELSACLAANDSDLGAAECQAIVSAILCLQNEIDIGLWSRRLLSGDLEANTDEAPPESAFHDQDLTLIKNLISDTLQQLNDPDLSFTPLLPEEDDGIEERSAALGEWCQGYLYGLGLGGLKSFDHLSEQAREFTQDLIQISRLEIESQESEANENAFFEIVEYVRMGVLMMRDELLAGDRSTGQAPTPTESKITLH